MSENASSFKSNLSNLLWAIKAFWGDNKEKANERYFLKQTKNMIPDYVNNNSLKKLNIGSQDHPFEGWLNVDIFAFEGVAYMDATKPFPIADNCFDYVFSEHMIEHITFDEANFMLKECYRIMKPGARIRIITPGLDKLILLYGNTTDTMLKKYTDDLIQPTFNTPITPHIDYALNYISYNYLHKFIHSTQTLSHLLTLNGFKNIKSYELYKSDDPNLSNIEIHAKLIGEDKYDFESIYIEAEK